MKPHIRNIRAPRKAVFIYIKTPVLVLFAATAQTVFHLDEIAAAATNVINRDALKIPLAASLSLPGDGPSNSARFITRYLIYLWKIAAIFCHAAL